MADLATRESLQALAEPFWVNSRAPATRRAYTADWEHFVSWCRACGLTPLPSAPETVAAYLADCATPRAGAHYRASTIGRRLSTINTAHRLAGHPAPGTHPTVAATMAGIRRTLGTRPDRAVALTLPQLRAVLSHIPTHVYPRGVVGCRNRLLLLIGWAGAFRRSELVAIDTGHVTLHPDDGLHILVPQSKTDQDGAGTIKGIPFGDNPSTCAPCALTRWLLVYTAESRSSTIRELLDRNTGHICHRLDTASTLAKLPPSTPLFPRVHKSGQISSARISGQSVSDILNQYGTTAGLNTEHLSSHSLRAGFVTTALRSGATHHEVMRQTGHRNPATVEVYARETDPLTGNAVTKVGL